MDSAKFKALIIPHYDAMLRMAAAVLADTDTARDAVQDALVALWGKRRNLTSIADLRAYCISSAKSKAIDIMRRRAPHSVGSIADMDSPDPSPSAHRRMVAAETLSDVNRLIASLPPMQRRVLELRSSAQCSVAEISDTLGLSPDNVRQLLSRARRQLRESYINTHRYDP